MQGFLENRIYRCGCSILKAKAFHNNSVLFERLHGDGTPFDYCIGCGVKFDGDNVSWDYGKYPMHHDFNKALKVLEKC